MLFSLRRRLATPAAPAKPVPRRIIVAGSGIGAVVGWNPPILICATSSTLVTVMATVVVNITLEMRWPMIAVIVKKF